jgi:hypothetical protein
VKRHLRQLHDALAVVTAGPDKLAAERTAFDEYERTTRAELTAQAAKLREGQVALATAKDAREDPLAERERRIRELEAAWKFVGEDNVDDVARGFRAAEFSALMKARAAHGIGRDHGLDDIAKTMADWQPPTRNVNHDPQGVPFAAHTSLSRSESAPPGLSSFARAAIVMSMSSITAVMSICAPARKSPCSRARNLEPAKGAFSVPTSGGRSRNGCARTVCYEQFKRPSAA